MGIDITKEVNVLSLTVYTEADAFEILESEWNNLLVQSQSNRIFSTWEWQSTWWSAYHPGKLQILAIRNADDQLVGLAPLFMDEMNTIHFVGSEDVTDYLDVIAHQDFEQEVYASVAQYLADNQADFNAINLCNIPANSPSLSGLMSALSEFDFAVQSEPMEVCPVISLGNDWEGYLANLDKKQRHEIRRKLRRASSDNIEWYIVDDTHDLDAELDKFLYLMTCAGSEKSEFLQNDKHVTFFKQIVPVFYAKGWLQLAIITMDGEPAAGYLNFVYGNEVGVYNSGLNVEVGGVFSLGIVLLAHLINHAIVAGHTRFDMLRGNETYKYRIGGQDEEIYRLTARLG